MDLMVRLYAAANLQDAYLILGLLAGHGIAARVLNENAQGGMGEIPFTQVYPEVWLDHEGDLERAREIVTSFERRDTPSAMACPICGEENPRTFEVCWQCGTALR